VVCICYELLFSITDVSIYYWTQSNIWEKIYCLLNFQRAFVLYYKCLDILWDSIRHLSKNLLSFEFPTSFRFQLRASRYTTGHNRTSELKVIVFWICSEFLFSISSISIYYGTQSVIRVKSYCGLHLLRASVFNFEHLHILRVSFWTSELKVIVVWIISSFHFLFRASRYITRLNRISELKVIVVCICYELLFSITAISIYYGTQSNIWVKIYCLLNFQRAFVYNYERLDIF